jgi:hypothetical protein
MVQFIFGRFMQEHWDESLHLQTIFSKRFHLNLAANELITIDDNEIRSHFEGYDDQIILKSDLSEEEKETVNYAYYWASWGGRCKKPIVTVDYKKYGIHSCWHNMNQIDELFYNLEYDQFCKQITIPYGKDEYTPDKEFTATSKDEALTKMKELFDEGYYIFNRGWEVELWVRKEK